MHVRYSTRVKLGLALIVFVILTSTLRQLTSTLSSFRALPQTDDISQYERRFTAVKHSLPPNQIISYSDEYAEFPGQCNAFILARYSLAPTVLDAPDSYCHITDAGQVSSQRSGLILYNSHDPRHEPYLLHLFPDTYFRPRNNPVSFAGGHLSDAAQVVLVKDFGLGVRLYARGVK